LRRKTSSSNARFVLEVYESQITRGRQFPFSHPFDWAAFFVTGASEVQFPKEGRS